MKTTTTTGNTTITTSDSATITKWENKLKALLESEAKKNKKSARNNNKILLGVQAKDKRLDFRHATTARTDDDAVDTQEPYFIASQTKLFTGAVIFQLIDEGLIGGLDDPISKYLPHDMIHKIHVYKGRDYSSEITIQELLHQTSGLPDYFLEKGKTTPSLFDEILSGKDPKFTVRDVLDKARDELTPKFQPSAKSGKKSFYSDTNYQLLGAIIEAVTKESIALNFESRIFLPLQLSRNTYLYNREEFNVSRSDTSDSTRQHPMLFYYKDKELKIPNTMSSFAPDGGIVSTLEDMLIFLRAYFDGQLFDKAHLAKIENTTEQWNTVLAPPIQYGLGVMRFKLPLWMTLGFRMPIFLGHSGANASFAFYAPEEQVFIVGTFNQLDQESRPFGFMMNVLQCLK